MKISSNTPPIPQNIASAKFDTESVARTSKPLDVNAKESVQNNTPPQRPKIDEIEIENMLGELSKLSSDVEYASRFTKVNGGDTKKYGSPDEQIQNLINTPLSGDQIKKIIDAYNSSQVGDFTKDDIEKFNKNFSVSEEIFNRSTDVGDDTSLLNKQDLNKLLQEARKIEPSDLQGVEEIATKLSSASSPLEASATEKTSSSSKSDGVENIKLAGSQVKELVAASGINVGDFTKEFIDEFNENFSVPEGLFDNFKLDDGETTVLPQSELAKLIAMAMKLSDGKERSAAEIAKSLTASLADSVEASGEGVAPSVGASSSTPTAATPQAATSQASSPAASGGTNSRDSVFAEGLEDRIQSSVSNFFLNDKNVDAAVPPQLGQDSLFDLVQELTDTLSDAAGEEAQNNRLPNSITPNASRSNSSSGANPSSGSSLNSSDIENMAKKLGDFLSESADVYKAVAQSGSNIPESTPLPDLTIDSLNEIIQQLREILARVGQQSAAPSQFDTDKLEEMVDALEAMTSKAADGSSGFSRSDLESLIEMLLMMRKVLSEAAKDAQASSIADGFTQNTLGPEFNSDFLSKLADELGAQASSIEDFFKPNMLGPEFNSDFLSKLVDELIENLSESLEAFAPNGSTDSAGPSKIDPEMIAKLVSMLKEMTSKIEDEASAPTQLGMSRIEDLIDQLEESLAQGADGSAGLTRSDLEALIEILQMLSKMLNDATVEKASDDLMSNITPDTGQSQQSSPDISQLLNALKEMLSKPEAAEDPNAVAKAFDSPQLDQSAFEKILSDLKELLQRLDQEPSTAPTQLDTSKVADLIEQIEQLLANNVDGQSAFPQSELDQLFEIAQQLDEAVEKASNNLEKSFMDAVLATSNPQTAAELQNA